MGGVCAARRRRAKPALHERAGQDTIGRGRRDGVQHGKGIDAPLTAADAQGLFEAILCRKLDDRGYAERLAASGLTIRGLIGQLRHCAELRSRVAGEIEQAEQAARAVQRDPLLYRCPPDLAATPTHPRRVLVVGSCLMQQWTDHIAALPQPCESELYLIGGDLPERPRRDIAEYDFMIVQLPLRSALPDCAFARLAQDDLRGHRQLFAHAAEVTRQMFTRAMEWNRAHGILSFVLPYLVPQQNPMGRLLPRNDLRNPVYFIERLNRLVAELTEVCAGAYLFDLNEVLATHGRRFAQEDIIVQLNHGSFLSDFDFALDQDRLEPPHRASEVYQRQMYPIITAAWHELTAMAATVRQHDLVKMVVVDLDDTLWRGVLGERDGDALPTAEGWPQGLWEALAILRRRGIVLAIASQNDAARVEAAWARIFGRRLTLDDFAIRRIDWRPRVEKLADILFRANFLPENVLYIDDNPVQRAEMAGAYPGLRVLGGDPFTWRHILLWSPQTQGAAISAESSHRSQSLQAIDTRERAREAAPRADFLAGLGVRMTLFDIANVEDARFARALELINKTNQYNTTGERRTQAECMAAFAAGVRLRAFSLADIYTDYGMVGVAWLSPEGIDQFVMSCRVLGLDAELAAVADAVGAFAARGRAEINARMIQTERNLPCRGLYAQCGFEECCGVWRRATAPGLAMPAHMALSEG
jgi:FkbH-like protein